MAPPPLVASPPLHAHSGPVSVPVPVSVPGTTALFLPERHMTSTGYPMTATATATGIDQQVYLIQTPSGMYQATSFRPVTGPVGQPMLTNKWGITLQSLQHGGTYCSVEERFSLRQHLKRKELNYCRN